MMSFDSSEVNPCDLVRTDRGTQDGSEVLQNVCKPNLKSMISMLMSDILDFDGFGAMMPFDSLWI